MRLGGKSLISDFLLVIVVRSVRGAFSGRISWHMVFLLNVTAQVSQCKKKKKKVGQKCSLLDKKTKLCNFAQREKKQPLNVTSILSFLLAENGRLFMTCICKLVLPKYKHCFFFTPDNFCCYSYC